MMLVSLLRCFYSPYTQSSRRILNPHAERFVKSIKYECLNHFILLGERHLRYVVNEYMDHYHEERFHQGLDGQLILPKSAANSDPMTGSVRRRTRLGGLLSFYYLDAA
jgi:putative transposase